MHYFLSDTFVHHINVNFGYLPVNEDGSDFFRIQNYDINPYRCPNSQ